MIGAQARFGRWKGTNGHYFTADLQVSADGGCGFCPWLLGILLGLLMVPPNSFGDLLRFANFIVSSESLHLELSRSDILDFWFLFSSSGVTIYFPIPTFLLLKKSSVASVFMIKSCMTQDSKNPQHLRIPF